MSYSKKIIYVLVSVILIHFFLIYVNKYINENLSDLHQQEKSIDSLKEIPPILIMGDSHTAISFDTETLKNSISIAFNAENNVLSFYRLQNIVEIRGKKPKLLILGITPFTHSSFINSINKNHEFYLPFINAEEIDELSGEGYEWRKKKITYSIFPYLELWKKLTLRDIADVNTNPATLEEIPEFQKIYAAKRMVKKINPSDDKSFFEPISLIYLEKLIKLCTKNKIFICFIKLPVNKYFYNELMESGGQNYFYLNPAEKIILENKNCILLDYTFLFPERDEFFSDIHHLNKEGALFFTNTIKPGVDSLLSIIMNENPVQ